MNKTNPEGLPTMYSKLSTVELQHAHDQLTEAIAALASVILTIGAANGGDSKPADPLWLHWEALRDERTTVRDELEHRAMRGAEK